MREANPYQVFDTRLAARLFITLSMLRVTLRGDDLEYIEPIMLDQRFKIALCDGDIAQRFLDASGNQMAVWRELPTDVRPVLRTYTFADVRNGAREIDFDAVIHDGHAHGAGSQFRLSAPMGSRVLVFGPDKRFEGSDEIGIAWKLRRYRRPYPPRCR